MVFVFTFDSIWNWEAKKNYRRLVEENPDLVKLRDEAQRLVAESARRRGL